MSYQIAKLFCHNDESIFSQDFAIGSDWAIMYQGVLNTEFRAAGLSSITWLRIRNYMTPLAGVRQCGT